MYRLNSACYGADRFICIDLAGDDVHSVAEPSDGSAYVFSARAGHSSVAFTYDRYGHLFPEVDSGAAAKRDALRNSGPIT